MDSNIINSEPRAVAGPSGTRKRSKSSSSDGESDSTSSSSSTSYSKRKSRRYRRKRNRHSDKMVNKLFEEVGELRKLITGSNNIPNIYTDIDREGSVNRSEGLYEHSQQNVDIESTTQQFTFDIETKLKEPVVPKTTEFFF